MGTRTQGTTGRRRVAARWATVAGMLAAALGLLVLRFSGVPMPAVPPALVLLVAAAALVAAVDRRWAVVVGLLVVAAEITGLVLGGGLAGLADTDSVGVLVGSWVRVGGVAVAALAGLVAVSVPRRR